MSSTSQVHQATALASIMYDNMLSG